MLKILQAEYIKQSHSFEKNIIWLTPILALIITTVLMAGIQYAFSEALWNWWYSLYYQIMLALICYLNIKREKKSKYFYLTSLPTSKSKLIIGKMLYISLLGLLSNLLVFIFTSIGGFIFTTTVPVSGALLTVLILTITSLWQIPLYLFLSIKFGLVITMLTSFILTVSGTVIASSNKWIYFVSAIPMRVLTPVLRIIPNGLHLQPGSSFDNYRVLLYGIPVSMIWSILFVLLFIIWYSKTEQR